MLINSRVSLLDVNKWRPPGLDSSVRGAQWAEVQLHCPSLPLLWRGCSSGDKMSRPNFSQQGRGSIDGRHISCFPRCVRKPMLAFLCIFWFLFLPLHVGIPPVPNIWLHLTAAETWIISMDVSKGRLPLIFLLTRKQQSVFSSLSNREGGHIFGSSVQRRASSRSPSPALTS